MNKINKVKGNKAKGNRGLFFKKTKKEKVIMDLNGNVIKKEKPQKRKILVTIKENISKYKKIYLAIVAAILLALVIYFIYIGIRNYIIDKKYGKYEAKMNQYGLSLMYDNESAKSTEMVSRNEMIRMVLATIYNTDDIQNIGFTSQGKFDKDEWAITAKAFGIISDEYINETNYNKLSTYYEAIKALVDTRAKEMKLPAAYTTESNFKNLQSLTEEQRRYINDIVENGLIEDGKGKITINNDMFKGEFNELIVNFVEKYNSIVPEGETLVTKDESKPSNADKYPYILYSVDKDVYEYPFFGETADEFILPSHLFKYQKSRYSQIVTRTEYYYNLILNVNYNNISVDKFMEECDKFFRYAYDKEEFEKYVEYVKANKIIIEGNAKVQLPIIYVDGTRYRARVKLEFEIKNSNTKENILFGDMLDNKTITYNKDKYTVYIDAPMGMTVLSRSLRLDFESVINMRVDLSQDSSKTVM